MTEFPDSFFRELSSVEEADFKKWAQDNFKVSDEIEEVWHPIVKRECLIMQLEACRKSVRKADKCLKEVLDII